MAYLHAKVQLRLLPSSTFTLTKQSAPAFYSIEKKGKSLPHEKPLRAAAKRASGPGRPVLDCARCAPRTHIHAYGHRTIDNY
jgi:hypothetical protein